MLLPLVVGWAVIGIIIAFVATKVINLRGDDPKIGMAVSALGAVLFGIIYNVYSGFGLTGWNTWSLMFAAIGGLAFTIVWHIIRSRFVSHERYVPRRSY